MKKRLAILMALGMVASSLAGCGGSDNPAPAAPETESTSDSTDADAAEETEDTAASDDEESSDAETAGNENKSTGLFFFFNGKPGNYEKKKMMGEKFLKILDLN